MTLFLVSLGVYLALAALFFALGRAYERTMPCSCARVLRFPSRHAAEHHRPARLSLSHREELRLLHPPFDYESGEPA